MCVGKLLFTASMQVQYCILSAAFRFTFGLLFNFIYRLYSNLALLTFMVATNRYFSAIHLSFFAFFDYKIFFVSYSPYQSYGRRMTLQRKTSHSIYHIEILKGKQTFCYVSPIEVL